MSKDVKNERLGWHVLLELITVFEALAAGATPQSLAADVNSNVNADLSNADLPSNEHDDGATNADLSSSEQSDSVYNVDSSSEWESDDGSQAGLLSNEQSDKIEIGDAEFMRRVRTMKFLQNLVKDATESIDKHSVKLGTICGLRL